MRQSELLVSIIICVKIVPVNIQQEYRNINLYRVQNYFFSSIRIANGGHN